MKNLVFLLVSFLSTAAMASSPCMNPTFTYRESMIELVNFRPEVDGTLFNRLNDYQGLTGGLKQMSQAGQVIPMESLSVFTDMSATNKAKTSQLQKTLSDAAEKARARAQDVLSCVAHYHESQCANQIHQTKDLFENYIAYIQAGFPKLNETDRNFDSFVQGLQQAAQAGIPTPAPVCDTLSSYTSKEIEIQRERISKGDQYLVLPLNQSFGSIIDCLGRL